MSNTPQASTTTQSQEWPWPDSLDAFKTPPEVLWSAPLPPHSLENVGDADLDLISVELKDLGSTL